MSKESNETGKNLISEDDSKNTTPKLDEAIKESHSTAKRQRTLPQPYIAQFDPQNFLSQSNTLSNQPETSLQLQQQLNVMASNVAAPNVAASNVAAPNIAAAMAASILKHQQQQQKQQTSQPNSTPASTNIPSNPFNILNPLRMKMLQKEQSLQEANLTNQLALAQMHQQYLQPSFENGNPSFQAGVPVNTSYTNQMMSSFPAYSLIQTPTVYSTNPGNSVVNHKNMAAHLISKSQADEDELDEKDGSEETEEDGNEDKKEILTEIEAKKQRAREKNRVHSRNSRLRKKDSILRLREENTHLQMYRVITEAMADMVSLHDLSDEARVIYANPSFIAKFAIPTLPFNSLPAVTPQQPHRRIPSCFLQLVHEEDTKALIDCLRLVRIDATQAPILSLRMLASSAPPAADGSRLYSMVQSRIQACAAVGTLLIVTRPLGSDGDFFRFFPSQPTSLAFGGITTVATTGFVI